MSDEPDPERLKALEARLRAMKGEEAENAPREGTDLNQANLGWQMIVELVVGIAIGFGMGYGLDRFFGTMPIMLVLFTLLGFAAGIKVMLGTAAQMQQQAAAKAGAKEKKDL